MAYTPPALFVAWREPESHRIFPVGRLLRLQAPFQGYEFCYIEGARRPLAGFQPFLAFPNLDEVYRSRALLPFFQNRVLSPSRPDYAEYVESLALDAREAEPMTLLAVSGGRRTTDLVELFPDWIVLANGTHLETRLLVRGVQHVTGAEERIEGLSPGARLHCTRDVLNAFNPQAIKLHTQNGGEIGYVPDYLAADLTFLLEHHSQVEIRVQRVNPPPFPHHHRVLCVLSVSVAGGFVGYRGPSFRPISSEATDIEDRAAAALSSAAAG